MTALSMMIPIKDAHVLCLTDNVFIFTNPSNLRILLQQRLVGSLRNLNIDVTVQKLDSKTPIPEFLNWLSLVQKFCMAQDRKKAHTCRLENAKASACTEALKVYGGLRPHSPYTLIIFGFRFMACYAIIDRSRWKAMS